MTERDEARSRPMGFLLWVIPAVIVMLIALLAFIKKPAESEETVGEKPVSVRTVVLEPRRISDVIVIPGRVEPLIEAVLAGPNSTTTLQ